jgi:dTDP-glucose 4,6-dehydratase
MTAAWCQRFSTGPCGLPMTVFGAGSQTRSFCYVSDLVDGLYRLMFSDERYPVNLGNPIELTILQFAEHIRRITGTASAIAFEPQPEDDPKRRKPDIAKARAVLGWEPRIPLEDGPRLTVEYFQGMHAPGAVAGRSSRPGRGLQGTSTTN